VRAYVVVSNKVEFAVEAGKVFLKVLKMQVDKSSDSIILAREGMTGNINATKKSESYSCYITSNERINTAGFLPCKTKANGFFFNRFSCLLSPLITPSL
jgi:hypothetical protein